LYNRTKEKYPPNTLENFLPSGLYRRHRNFTGSVCAPPLTDGSAKSRAIPPVGNYTQPWKCWY